MMQGVHDWYETLNKTYNNLGYKASQADPCICFKKESGNNTSSPLRGAVHFISKTNKTPK